MGVNKTFMVTFKDNATLQDIISVLNFVGLATNNEALASKWKNNKGIEVKEVGVITHGKPE